MKENIFKIIVSNEYKEVTTIEDNEINFSWGGNSMSRSSAVERTKKVFVGARISLYRIEDVKASNYGGYWSNGLTNIIADYKQMMKFSELYGASLPDHVTAQAVFSEKAEFSFVIETEEEEEVDVFYAQYEKNDGEWFFSDDEEVRLIPHKRFFKYAFKDCILEKVSDDDFSFYSEMFSENIKL